MGHRHYYLHIAVWLPAIRRGEQEPGLHHFEFTSFRGAFRELTHQRDLFEKIKQGKFSFPNPYWQGIKLRCATFALTT